MSKKSVHIRVQMNLTAPIDLVWQKLTDWPSQGDWMLLTQVQASKPSSEPQQIGNIITAFTGFNFGNPRKKFRIGLLDEMKITNWQICDNQRVCEVDHFGKWLKGFGRFELNQITSNTTQMIWYERIDSPFLFSLLTKPFTQIAVVVSLRRFRRKISN